MLQYASTVLTIVLFATAQGAQLVLPTIPSLTIPARSVPLLIVNTALLQMFVRNAMETSPFRLILLQM